MSILVGVLSFQINHHGPLPGLQPEPPLTEVHGEPRLFQLSASFWGVQYHVIYLSTYLSTYLSIYLCVYLSIDLSIYPSFHRCICLSIHRRIYVCVYLFVYLSINQSVNREISRDSKGAYTVRIGDSSPNLPANTVCMMDFCSKFSK